MFLPLLFSLSMVGFVRLWRKLMYGIRASNLNTFPAISAIQCVQCWVFNKHLTVATTATTPQNVEIWIFSTKRNEMILTVDKKPNIEAFHSFHLRCGMKLPLRKTLETWLLNLMFGNSEYIFHVFLSEPLFAALLTNSTATQNSYKINHEKSFHEWRKTFLHDDVCSFAFWLNLNVLVFFVPAPISRLSVLEYFAASVSIHLEKYVFFFVDAIDEAKKWRKICLFKSKQQREKSENSFQKWIASEKNCEAKKKWKAPWNTDDDFYMENVGKRSN